VQAAQGAVHTKASFYRAKFNKLVFRLGNRNKAKVAIANKLARVTYKILAGGVTYKDLGYMRGDPREQKIQKHMRALKSLGVDIRYHNHQIIDSKKTFFVDASGIVKA
jgi:hypothetical protein